MSCSGSRERKDKRVLTPVTKKLGTVSLQDIKSNPSNSSKISKQSGRNYINKYAAHRKITLQSKERPINNTQSDKLITTITKPKTHKKRHNPHSKRFEINLKAQRSNRSERDNTYSAAVLSTQEHQIQTRTLDHI